MLNSRIFTRNRKMSLKDILLCYLAIDGSKAEISNSKENREVFGVSANQYLKQCSMCALKRYIKNIHNDINI